MRWFKLKIQWSKIMVYSGATNLCNSPMSIYSLCGCLDKVYEIFKGMPDRNIRGFMECNDLGPGLLWMGMEEMLLRRFVRCRERVLYLMNKFLLVFFLLVVIAGWWIKQWIFLNARVKSLEHVVRICLMSITVRVYSWDFGTSWPIRSSISAYN